MKKTNVVLKNISMSHKTNKKNWESKDGIVKDITEILGVISQLTKIRIFFNLVRAGDQDAL